MAFPTNISSSDCLINTVLTLTMKYPWFIISSTHYWQMVHKSSEQGSLNQGEMYGTIKLEIEIFQVISISLTCDQWEQRARWVRSTLWKPFPKHKVRNSKNISIAVTFIVLSIGLSLLFVLWMHHSYYWYSSPSITLPRKSV